MTTTRTPDANGWLEGLHDAPKGENPEEGGPRILVLLPDDENEAYDHELAYWDPASQRWEGEWRNLVLEDGVTPHPFSFVEPTHYKPGALDLPVEPAAEEAAA